LWPGRLINAFVVVGFLCEVLNVLWPLAKKAIGWFLIPIGQDSLNVFLFHLFLVALVEPITEYAQQSSLISTVIHIGLLMLTFLFVKYRSVFSWKQVTGTRAIYIPRKVLPNVNE
jgi:hypothetical protein